MNIRLQGRQGNPTAIGARLTIALQDGSTQTAEVNAGGGYLSQSTSTLTFGLSQTNKVKAAQIRWPDGSISAINSIPDQTSLTLKQQ
jgi:hypothetical protein